MIILKAILNVIDFLLFGNVDSRKDRRAKIRVLC